MEPEELAAALKPLEHRMVFAVLYQGQKPVREAVLCSLFPVWAVEVLSGKQIVKPLITKGGKPLEIGVLLRTDLTEVHGCWNGHLIDASPIVSVEFYPELTLAKLVGKKGEALFWALANVPVRKDFTYRPHWVRIGDEQAKR